MQGGLNNATFVGALEHFRYELFDLLQQLLVVGVAMTFVCGWILVVLVGNTLRRKG